MERTLQSFYQALTQKTPDSDMEAEKSRMKMSEGAKPEGWHLRKC